MAIVILQEDYKALERQTITFSGTVSEESNLVARMVHLYKQSNGSLAGSVLSSSVDGTWSIEVCDNTNTKYFAVAIPIADDKNADVFANLTGV